MFSIMMPAIRKTVKQIVPERVRLLCYELYEKARYYLEIVFSLGRRLECPFCKWHFRRFRPSGFHYPILSEKRVVGGHWHQDNVCPRCLSNARERLVYLFIKNRTEVYNRRLVDNHRLRILHIAPEPKLMSTLLQCPHVVYITADLFESGVMTRFDILSMPFARDTFDVVICNHVMEHVPDDQVAMAEVFRVLRP